VATARDFSNDWWENELRQSLIQFIAGRVTFYLLGESLLNYGFSHRVFNAAIRLVKLYS